MMWRRSVLAVLAISVFALAPGGCASSSPDAKKSAPRSNISDPAPDPPGQKTAPISTSQDPCAERLHALCGPLLFYYALNKRMPETLEELAAIGGPEPDIEFTCPVSGKPYVYDPQGLPRPGKPGVLVLYDAAPSHSGMRWAVAVEPPKPGQALIPQVVVEEELTFQLAREQPE